MRDEIRTAPKLALFAGVATSLMLAAFILTGYSFSVGHRAACDSRNATASLFHDVIVIASTPDKGSKPRPLTSAERRREHRIFVRIDQTRC